MCYWIYKLLRNWPFCVRISNIVKKAGNENVKYYHIHESIFSVFFGEPGSFSFSWLMLPAVIPWLWLWSKSVNTSNTLVLPAVIPWLWFCSKLVHTGKALVGASRQLAVVSSLLLSCGSLGSISVFHLRKEKILSLLCEPHWDSAVWVLTPIRKPKIKP